MLTFAPDAWHVAQVVTVTGVDDVVDDGAQAYQVVFSSSSSVDLVYRALPDVHVDLINQDDAVSELLVQPIAVVVSETGSTAELTVQRKDFRHLGYAYHWLKDGS